MELESEDEQFTKIRNVNGNELNTMVNIPCKLRRSTQWQFDCRWCGTSCQEYDDTVCDNCGVKYNLDIYFEPYGTTEIRVFGEGNESREFLNGSVLSTLFQPLLSKFDGRRVSDGWVFDEAVRSELIKFRIENWYGSSEVSAQIQHENEVWVDI